MIDPLPPAGDPDADLWRAICGLFVLFTIMLAVGVARAMLAGRL